MLSSLGYADVAVEAQRKIEHNYLPAQFADMDVIWAKVRKVVEAGDFTLGKALAEFEAQAAAAIGVKHCIGVNSGTDALILIMKALGITGEVIVPAFTFVATVAAVELAGARPVLVDVGNDFNMNVEKLEAAITTRTQAIIPVHWAGRACDMDVINAIALERNLHVIEDACHAIGAGYHDKQCGALGEAAAFSLHPLKNVNVWGDGGFITTNNDTLATKLRLYRNHGLSDRNTCDFYAHNSRLDTIQAVVANHVLDKLPNIVAKRRHNAQLLGKELARALGIIEERLPEHKHHSYYLYTVHAQFRNELLQFLNDRGVDAKAHYPIAMHMQPAAAYLGYEPGSFPMAEYCAASTISFPVHEFVTDDDIHRMGHLVQRFYAKHGRMNGG